MVNLRFLSPCAGVVCFCAIRRKICVPQDWIVDRRPAGAIMRASMRPGLRPAMNSNRTRMMLTAAVLLLAVLGANSAMAGYVRVKASFFATGTGALANSDAGASQPNDLAEDAAACDSAAGPRPESSDQGSEKTRLQNTLDRYWQDLLATDFSAKPTGGSTGGASGSSSGATGPGSVAMAASVALVHEATLSGRLPDEMGPKFCNPPPGEPLHVPR